MANEIGFDYLRDQIAFYPQDQVHRPFAAAVIDEVDSILIDEARIRWFLPAASRPTRLFLSGRSTDAPLQTRLPLCT